MKKIVFCSTAFLLPLLVAAQITMSISSDVLRSDSLSVYDFWQDTLVSRIAIGGVISCQTPGLNICDVQMDKGSIVVTLSLQQLKSEELYILRSFSETDIMQSFHIQALFWAPSRKESVRLKEIGAGSGRVFCWQDSWFVRQDQFSLGPR